MMKVFKTLLALSLLINIHAKAEVVATPENQTQQQTPTKDLSKDNNFTNVPVMMDGSTSGGTQTAGTGGGAAAGQTPIVPKPQDADNDAAGIGLDSDKHINNAMGQMKAVVEEASCTNVIYTAVNYQKIAQSGQKYMADKPTCVSRQEAAANACLEHLSPHILSGVTTLNTLLSTIGAVSANESCSNFAKAMNVGKAAMTAYSAACGLMKAGCGYSCVGARKGLEGIKAAVPKGEPFQCKPAVPPTDYSYASLEAKCAAMKSKYTAALQEMIANVENELNKGEKKSVAGKASICTEKYAALITSSLTGALALAQAMKQGKNCDDKTNGTGTTTAQTTAEKCAVAANATLPECICLANPRTPGCANSYQKPGENSAAQVATGAGSSANVDPSRDVASFGGDNGSGIDRSEKAAGDGAGGGVGAPVGGGGAGLGGSSGVGGGGAPGKEGAGKKGLDANILGGAGGGGGGGWGGFGGGGSGSDKYRSYLPGGDKDPNKAMAGQQAWTKEVTGQGGKSNWEKVKDRYRDNKSTLLNN